MNATSADVSSSVGQRFRSARAICDSRRASRSTSARSGPLSTTRFARARDLGERRASEPPQPPVERLDFRDATRLVKHVLEIVEELVARRALHRPAWRELFAVRENLLDDDRRVGATSRRAADRGSLRIEQTVDVVDAQPVDDIVAHQVQHQRVRLVEHRGIFDA